MSVGDRKALAQIRCGSAPLQIEKGRYDHGTYLPVNERPCPVCLDGTEDEKHVIIYCNQYKDIQNVLFKIASQANNNFMSWSDEDKFIFLMSDKSIIKHTAKACRDILNRRYMYINK